MTTSVPGQVQAAEECGSLVCAEAIAVATWTCETTDDAVPGYDFIGCVGVGRPDGRGYSPHLSPGSLTWSGSVSVRFTYDHGENWFNGGRAETAPSTCAWPGLGENGCGGSGREQVYNLGGYVPFGSCLTSSGFDFEFTVEATATASKSLPLGLGEIESPTATETKQMRLSDVPQSERCAFQ